MPLPPVYFPFMTAPEALKETTGLSRKDVKIFVDRFLEQLAHHLEASDKVQLTGFGTFEVRERSARTGVNPSTGEKTEIPAGKYPAFKPGKSLKDEVN